MTDDPLRETSSRFVLERSPLHQLHHLNQRLSEIFESEFEGGELTARQFAVLLAVSHEDGISQTGLVQKTGIDRSTLAEIVKRMLKKGYISRRRMKEDARAYSVKITERGEDILRLAEPIAKKIDASILAALPEGQGSRFLSDMRSVLQAFRNKQKQRAQETNS